MKKLYNEKNIFLTKSQLCELRPYFRLVFHIGHACAMIVHTQADQLLPQSLLEQFDTLHSQYRHIGHLHDEV